MALKFQAHGQFRTWVEGRVIFSDVVGPWNRELVEQCLLELDAHARILAATGPHVGVAVVHESILCPPDAFEALGRAVAYTGAHLNCLGNAVVCAPGVEGRQLVMPMYRAMYSGHMEFLLADDVESARRWALGLLAQHGYPQEQGGPA
jgi:hypothetical protein